MILRFGTSEAGGTFHTQAVAIAELFNRRYSGEENCIVRTNLVTLDDVKLLDRGDLEFGLMASNWVGRAKDGSAPFDRPIALRMVAPANAGPVFFVTLKNSPIKTVGDLAGKRVAIGPKGGGMAQHAEVILGILGISLARLTPVYLGVAEAGDALIQGEIDALWQRPIPNQAMTDLSERADVQIVALPAPQLDKLVAQVPFYRKVIIEQGAFRGVSEHSSQVGVVNVIVTHEQVAQQPVCAMAKTIAENLDTLPKLNPLFKTAKALFEPLRSQGAAAFEFAGVPLHRGALRAYKELGWLK
jgi:TRAP transporter TAXI family solute receptor